MRIFIGHEHVDDEVMKKRINKRYGSNLALKSQDPYDYLQRLAENYEWMRADRDMWKSMYMEMIMEERKRKRDEKKNSD